MANTTVERPAEDAVQQNELIGIYRLMLLIRRLEETVYRKFKEDKIGGYLHRYDGMEALVAGVIPLLKLPGDYILCTYRDHAHALAVGTPAREVMAELMGRATGCAGGKGGSMHLTDPERGFLGGDGIVGGPVPVSLGVGFALKYKKTSNICVCYFGDGAMNQGGVHETFNMVGLYKVPVLYILENNGYAMGTSIQRSTGQPDFVQKAKAHGIAGEHVDGMDIFAVREAAQRAIDRIRKTGEAYFLELSCERFVGHGFGDDSSQAWKTYRTPEMIDEARRRDPLVRLQSVLEARGVLTSDDCAKFEQEVMDEVKDAIRFAENSPEPPLDSLYENVYS